MFSILKPGEEIIAKHLTFNTLSDMQGKFINNLALEALDGSEEDE